MNENTLFIQALNDVIDEDYNADVEAISLNDEHEFSDKHNKKMKKLIKRQSRPYFNLISTAGRRVACVVVAMIVLSASALSVEAVRNAVYDFIIKIFSNHSVVTTESGTDDGIRLLLKKNIIFQSCLPVLNRLNMVKQIIVFQFFIQMAKKEFYLTRMSKVIIRYIWIMSERILRRSRSMVRNICSLNLILM